MFFKTGLLCLLVLFLADLCCSQSTPDANFASKCSSFQTKIGNVTQVATTHFAAGANVTIPGGGVSTTQLPAFCRTFLPSFFVRLTHCRFAGVQLLIFTDPVANQFANTEVWLPDNWNNRFLGIGNGGTFFDVWLTSNLSHAYS